MRIVLASRSERRIELLRQMGYRFETIPADVDETPPPGLDAHEVSRRLAIRKAHAVALTLNAGLVIGADTVVAVDNQIIGKPADDADAACILRRLSGRRSSVITGVCLIDVAAERAHVDSDETVVTMAAMTDEQIRDYIASGLSTGKAGAYSYQEHDDPYVTSFEGSYTNILGLPTELLAKMLAEWGIRPDCHP
jgi:septum formation protein